MANVSLRAPARARYSVIGFAKAALCGTAVAALAASMPAPAQADDMDELRSELQQLLDRMERVEQSQAQTEAAVEQGSAGALIVNHAIRNRATPMTVASRLNDMYITPDSAANNYVVGGDFPGSFKLPGSDASMSIYGFIKADFIHDFGPLRAFPGLVNPGLIPIGTDDGGGDQGTTNFRVNPSQINLETRFPSEYGEVRTLIQFDFFREDNEALAGGPAGPNNSTVNEVSAGLRLAQASIGPLTVGQHWWSFTDLAQYAETMDYENLNSAPLGRLPGITWADSVGGGFSYAIGAYDPVVQIGGGPLFTAAQTNANDTNIGIPDITGNVKYAQDWGHLFLSGQVRTISYEVDSSNNAGAGAFINATGKSSDTAVGWGLTLGLNLSDPLGLHPRDRFYTNGTYGEGMRGIIDESLFCFSRTSAAGCSLEGTVSDVTGELDTNKNFAYMAHYQHWWTDTVRSYFIYGQTRNIPGNDFDLVGTIRRTQYAVVNLVWSPVPRVNFGIETQYAEAKFKAAAANVANNAETVQFQASALFLF